MFGYTNLFLPNEYEKNDKIILKYFQWLKRLRWKNSKSIMYYVKHQVMVLMIAQVQQKEEWVLTLVKQIQNFV